MKTRLTISSTLALLASLGISSNTALAASAVTVVHGIPGGDLGLDPALPVDVSINGECALEQFVFGQIVGGVQLEAGMYDIAIRLADPGDPCGNDPVIEANDVELFDGENYSIVAHLTAAGSPKVSTFVNDAESYRYRANVNVFHAAAAPEVDIMLKRSYPWWWSAKFLTDVANGDQGSVRVIQGEWNVSIFPVAAPSDGDDDDNDDDNEGSGDPVFGPVPVELDRDTVYLVYAVGSLTNNTFTLLVAELVDPAPASAFVVHGIPGEDLGLDPELAVDVSVNDSCELEGFLFGEIVGPIDLDAGLYNFAISLANPADPCGNDPVIEAYDVELAGGESYSIVAHLDEFGAAKAGVFTNNLNAAGPWSRVNVFHAAAAPPVDVEFQRLFPWWWRPILLRDVANGESGDKALLRGNWDASILPAGADDAVLGPATLGLERKTAYLVYAVGSLANETFQLLIEEMDGQ